VLENLIQSTTIPLLQQVVNFSQSRHNVLAGNIANLDTPGYHARDLSVDDFHHRLKEAIETQHHQPLGRSPGETAIQLSRQKMEEVSKDPTTILRHDDGNVSMEQQVSEMVKNQMQHNLALTIMRSQFQLLQVAISERV
jgi:flagellar basal-body rod protein FlgB